MSQQITLDLPESIMEQAKLIAKRDGRSISDLLVELIEQGVSVGSIQSNVYPTETPYGNEEAAKILQRMSHSSNVPMVIKKH